LVDFAAGRARYVQRRIGRPFGLENLSTYVELRASTMSEHAFYTRAHRRRISQHLSRAAAACVRTDGGRCRTARARAPAMVAGRVRRRPCASSKKIGRC